jgi:subtilisin family serine protease
MALMDPLELIKLNSLTTISNGSQEVTIGLIDGPIDTDHPALQNVNIRTIGKSSAGTCKRNDSLACIHGTFIAGVLCAERGSNAPGICPNCKIILKPIFAEPSSSNRINEIFKTTQSELADAILETINAGARIINLSLGMYGSSLSVYHQLQDAYDYACKKGVIIIAAAGNQGNIGHVSLLNHPWVIPVAACDEYGNLMRQSNFGPSIAKSGLMAPGENIISTSPGGQYTTMSGTSVASAFVTGTVALLLSLFPHASSEKIISILARSRSQNSHAIMPPLLDAERSWEILGHN